MIIYQSKEHCIENTSKIIKYRENYQLQKNTVQCKVKSKVPWLN
jgi:hypothetical protein